MKVSIGTYPKQGNRKIDIRIDPWDTWNTDETLALIIVPLLKQLRDTKHGVPHTDQDDAPEEYRNQPEDFDEDQPQGYSEKRWVYILEEMIWAFTQQIDSTEYDTYTSNPSQISMVSEKVEGKTFSTIKFDYQKDPSKPPYTVDREGETAHNARVANGLRLFGKYYQSLWD